MNQGRKLQDELAQPDLFMSPAEVEAPPDATPEGFVYGTEIVPKHLAHQLTRRFATLPFKNFDFHGFQGNRRIVSFGWRYDYSGHGQLRESAPVPAFLDPLKRLAADFSGLESDAFQQALITEYAPGAGIG
jgi:alkylated DNA repair dioxygenase AlkB